MLTPVMDFSYDLPEELIAQVPVEPRDASRLLVLDRRVDENSPSSPRRGQGGGAREGKIHDLTHFSDIIDELHAGDVLVFNVSKVFNARLVVDGFEVFVLKVRDGEIDALVKGSRKLGVGAMIGAKLSFSMTVKHKTDDGVVTFRTGVPAENVFAFCEEHGEIPTPPYVKAKLCRADQYQTVYAEATGSVAAPTAGLHFTPELIERIRAKGVQVEHVTLHVGIGTFRPVQAEHIEDHVMHAEHVEIDAGTAERINAAKASGRRIIAVGTTTVRVLEGVAAQTQALSAFSGELNIFITPGFQFQVVNAIITNFHLPKSTLLMLIAAFAGRNNVLAAYRHAVEQKYRFFSFGDAMFIR